MQNIRDFIKKVCGPTVDRHQGGSAHILFLVLIFIIASGFWFVRKQSVGFPDFKLSEFKKEKQPSASGVVFSEKQEPAVEQAERYYKDHNVHSRRGH